VAEVPPLFLAAARFTFAAFPAILFVPRPAVPWSWLIAYGLFLGVGEFGLLFSAIKLGAPSGLSSIILQSQAFFTLILAALTLRERPRPASLAGMAVAALGLLLIAMDENRSGGVGPLPILMVVAAAFCWAAANIIARGMPGGSAAGLMVWSSLVSPLPLLALSLALEGPGAIMAAVQGLSLVSIGALVYLVLLSTILGYGVWNHLIMRHGASAVAPYSLLVPAFGLSAAALFLGERLRPPAILATGFVAAGLGLHIRGIRSGGNPARRPR